MATLKHSNSVLRAAAALCLCCLAIGAFARLPTAPLAAYGRLPTLEDVAISPDGTRVAFVKTNEDSRNLYIVELSGKILGSIKIGSSKLRQVLWQDDDRVLAVVSSTSPPPPGFRGPSQEWRQVARYTISRNSIQSIKFDARGEETFNVLTGRPVVRWIDGKGVLFLPGYYVSRQVRPAMFSFGSEYERPHIIAKGSEWVTDWLLDEAGRVAVQFEYKDFEKTWSIRTRLDDRLVTIATGAAPLDMPALLGFDLSGEHAIVQFMDAGEPVWRPISLKDGKIGEALEHGSALHDVITDPRNDRIIGGVSNGEDLRYVFFDNELQAHWNAIQRAFPNDIVRLASHSADFSKTILEVFGPENGYVYAYFDWYTHHAQILGRRYAEVKQIADIHKISYKAGDGLEIPGFLTLPRGTAARKLPLIVLPHDGPESRDKQDFNWWAQALADQGYAVLQPNFRGSSLSRMFVEAGYGEWGRKMQTDLSDGVHYLSKEGIIDPARVCIVGAGYGGYAALAGVTLQSGIYRCAVSVAGPSDLPRMRTWTRRTQLRLATRYWDRFWGVEEQGNDALSAISPFAHLDAVAAPVLLIHGRADTVVPYEQSEVMLNALKKANKPVEMVNLKHEDHWLSNSETRQQMLEATVSFLRLHNPPD
jgi:dipeptidyl aminopeptidase/acylaminoacyl peptidase